MGKFKKGYSFKTPMAIITAVLLLTNTVYSNVLRLPIDNSDKDRRLKDVIFRSILSTGKEVTFIRLNTFEEFKEYKEEMYDIAKDLTDTLPAGRIDKFTEQDMIRHVIYVVVIEGKAIGYILSEINEYRERTELYCWTIGVKDEERYRKKGIGNILLWLMANEAVQREISIMSADVDEDNDEALKFLERGGFKKRVKYVDGYFGLAAQTSLVIQKTTEEELIRRLSNENIGMIDDTLPILDEMRDHVDTVDIIEKVLVNKGLYLVFITNRDYGITTISGIKINTIRDNKTIGEFKFRTIPSNVLPRFLCNFMPGILGNELCLQFYHTYIDDEKWLGKRLFALVCRWMANHRYFLNNFSGSKIVVIDTSPSAAKAWFRSGFDDVKIISQWGDVIGEIGSITDGNKYRYDVICTFPPKQQIRYAQKEFAFSQRIKDLFMGFRLSTRNSV